MKIMWACHLRIIAPICIDINTIFTQLDLIKPFLYRRKCSALWRWVNRVNNKNNFKNLLSKNVEKFNLFHNEVF